METFTKNALCTKCGHDSIISSYHDENCSNRRCSGTNKEHITRCCTRCGYFWQEAPLNGPAVMHTKQLPDPNAGTQYRCVVCRRTSRNGYAPIMAGGWDGTFVCTEHDQDYRFKPLAELLKRVGPMDPLPPNLPLDWHEEPPLAAPQAPQDGRTPPPAAIEPDEPKNTPPGA